MMPLQTIAPIAVQDLENAVGRFRAEGHRLVQICCSRLSDRFEITYSFGRPGRLDHLRIDVAGPEVAVPSISSYFGGAFPYENEMHDLFGINVTGIDIDYKGRFFKTTVPQPFATPGCQIKTNKS